MAMAANQAEESAGAVRTSATAEDGDEGDT